MTTDNTTWKQEHTVSDAEPCYFCQQKPLKCNRIIYCGTIERQGDEQILCDEGRHYHTVEDWNERHRAMKDYFKKAYG